MVCIEIETQMGRQGHLYSMPKGNGGSKGTFSPCCGPYVDEQSPAVARTPIPNSPVSQLREDHLLSWPLETHFQVPP